MTRINLYPWRDAVEQRKKVNFLITLGLGCVGAFLLTLCQSWYYSHEISQQEANNQYLNNEIIFTNQKLREISKISSQKKAILERVSVLQDLDRQRHSATILFNEIVGVLNPLVAIKRIKREENKVSIIGFSDSNSGIAKFLRDIELSPHFDAAELDQIKVLNDEKEQVDEQESKHFFEMRFMQKIDLNDLNNSGNNNTEVQVSDD